MEKEFQKNDVVINGIYYCPPILIITANAVKEHNIDLRRSYMLGDNILDISAGKKVGFTTILIPEPHNRDEILSEKMNSNTTQIIFQMTLQML